jgi:ferric enterobactin receptor
MKLKTEAKLQSGQKQNNLLRITCLTLFLYFALFVSHGFAQIPSFSFNKTLLSDALVQISKEMNFTVAFDAKAMTEFQLSGQFTGQSPEQILTEVLKNTGFIAEKKFGNYLIVPEKPNVSTASVRIFSHISGLVTDQVSGEQIPHAPIFLPDQNLFLSTSVNGTFSFKIPAIKSIRINIQYLGYQSIDSTLTISDSTAVLTFRMKQKITELAPVQVRKARLKMISQNNEASHSTVNPIGFVNLPNMGESDIFRTIQLLPGIGYSENSSGLNIRGGTADQNLVLFDGFTLYNLDHFFGTFSSVNPNVVKDIQIYKGGFDSRYGERISGIIDITGKTGNKYSPKIYGGLNLISGNLTAEIPLSEKLTFVIAGRRSYADIYSSYLANAMFENQVEDIAQTQANNSIVQISPGYYFYDYNAKLTFSQTEKEKMSLSAFGGKDFLSSTGSAKLKQSFSKTTDDTNWGNYGFSYSWIKQWKEKFFSNLQVGYSGYQNNYNNQTAVTDKVKNKQVVTNFNTYEENNLNDFSATLRNEFTVNLKNSVDFGFQTKYNEYVYLKNLGDDSYYADIANSSWLYSTFLQFNTQAIKNLSLKLGGRISGYNLSNKLYYEPRFSGNYRIGNYLNFKFATGRYYQFLSKVTPTQAYGYNRDFWVIADDQKHPVQSSDHFIAGTSFTRNKFTFDVEAYYKTIDGLQLFLYIPPFQKKVDPGKFNPPGQTRKIQLPSKFITGEGHAYGVDFLLKYESARYTGWISYSRSKAVRNFNEINNNQDIPAPFDKTQEFKWTNLLTLGKWNFSGMWIYSTGQPYVSQHTVDKTLTAKFTYNRLPNFKRLDIAANYNFRIQKVNIKLGASVINLLNQDNYNDIYSRDFNFDSTSFNETTYVRSMGITPNFFISFQY